MTTTVLSKKPRGNVFVKISGDEYLNSAFRTWIRELVSRYFVVICVGGGTQVNEEYARRGFPVKKHGPMGREAENLEQRQVARDILEQNQSRLQDLLAAEGIFVTVEIPVLMIGTVLCHVNGDQMVRNAYLGFEKLFVITTPERLENKQKQFADLSERVEVLAFSAT